MAVRPCRKGVGIPSRERDGKEKEEVGRLLIVHHVIYASQCSHFSWKRNEDTDGDGDETMMIDSNDLNKSTSSTGSNNTITSLQSTTNTITSTDSIESKVSTISTGTSTSTTVTTQSTSTFIGRDFEHLDVVDDTDKTIIQHQQHQSEKLASEIELSTPLPRILNLPLIHLAIPHPSLLPLLNEWLYSPQPALLLYHLLNPPPSSSAERESIDPKSIKSRMESLDLHELLIRLKRIHAMWGNVVALGVGDERLWKVMGKAWDVVVNALEEKNGRRKVGEEGGVAGKGRE